MGLYRTQTNRFALESHISGTIYFETLVRTHQGVVRAFLCRISGDAALADDLAQESFVKAHGALHQLSSPEKARSWLFGIAYRTYADHARKEARRRALRETGTSEPPPPAVPSGQKLDIERAMDALTPDCRAVILLCLLHGMSHAEAAKTTGLPIGTVKSHIARGKVSLRLCLSDYAPRDKACRR